MVLVTGLRHPSCRDATRRDAQHTSTGPIGRHATGGKGRTHRPRVSVLGCARVAHKGGKAKESRALTLTVAVAVAGLLLVGCGASTGGAVAGTKTASPQPSLTRSATTPPPSAAPPPGPDLVVIGTTSHGDKARVEGKFGQPVTLSQIQGQGEEQGLCPGSDRRSMYVSLTLTTTVESSVAADIRENLGGEQEPRQTEICPGGEVDLGELAPNSPITKQYWLTLKEAISPSDPAPSLRTLGADWAMAVPTLGVAAAPTRSSEGGRRVLRCRGRGGLYASSYELVVPAGELPSRVVSPRASENSEPAGTSFDPCHRLPTP